MPGLTLAPMRAVAVAAVLLALAGCDITGILDNAVWGDPNPNADVTGEWAFNAWTCCSQSGDEIGTGAGSLFLTKDGGLAGSGVLIGDLNFTGKLAGGWRHGADIRFAAGRCSFESTIRGTAGDYVRGRYTCQVANGGTWQANRARQPVSASWPISWRMMVTGGTLDATILVRDAYGRQLGRDFRFTSSDTTVATVAGGGLRALITATGRGTATVTAAAADVSPTLTITGLGLVRFTSLSAADRHTCGLTTDSMALCWGSNASGQLGGGSWRDASTPVGVAGALAWNALSAAGARACGLFGAGAPYCWGNYDTVPALVAGGSGFSAIAAGERHACALTAAGSAYCWGANESGQLGNGNAAASPQPVLVIGGHTFTSIATGAAHTCALASDSTAWCWGSNWAGALGTGSAYTITVSAPQPVTGDLKFLAIGAGSGYTCAMAAGGAAWCWGVNDLGQLGTGTPDSAAAPVRVAGGLTFAALSAGPLGPCAIAAGGRAFCWGRHGDQDTTVVGGTVPAPVPGGLSFASISAGRLHVCGVATDGTAYCWGSNLYGQLGDGTAITRTAPVRVVGQR